MGCGCGNTSVSKNTAKQVVKKTVRTLDANQSRPSVKRIIKRPAR